ncbi:TlpA disulfide reductase family protein [Pedobacter nototheniae]|uniref:TlpA disulfide reductase family protein n=1 Tax=Pedobacter nototheniae TaxID=2488994 RepID=UPI002931A6EC|nr:TlpA disulfide reductase family protein [Pedobacter nototheniae]
MNKYIGIILLFFILIGCKAPNLTIKKYREMDTLSNSAKTDVLKNIIEHNPKDMMAHYWFIRESSNDTIELEKQYKAWMKKYPKVAEIPYSLGNALSESDKYKSNLYLNKAVEINPHLIQGWKSLYLDAYMKSDSQLMEGYLSAGIKANPNNDELAYINTSSLKQVNDVEYRKQLLENFKKFSKQDKGANFLLLLAIASTTPEDKIKYFDLLKFSYDPEKNRTSSDGMIVYFNYLLNDNFNGAMKLVKEMNQLKIKFEHWDHLLYELEKIDSAKNLIYQKKGKEALNILQDVKFPLFVGSDHNIIFILKAKAIALAVNDKLAYDSLITFFVKKPSLTLFSELSVYNNRNKSVIMKDILTYINEHAIQASALTLKELTSKDSISLNTLKNNVVLLTYWFPGCGPCRDEFPYFESVLKKVKPGSVKYVAINIDPKQDSLVLPMVKLRGYSFIPLTETKYRNKGNLDNMGLAPFNFLITANGLIAFENFRIDAHNEEDLKLMIDILLSNEEVI